MYISRLTLNRSRQALLWAANVYRVHQRLLIACENDPRLLFRVEDSEPAVILVQTHLEPDWIRAFFDFPVLACPPECKSFDLRLQSSGSYRFRLLANPAVRKTVEIEDGEKHKSRQGLLRHEDQIAWLRRKLEETGAELLDCLPMPRGLQRSSKNTSKDEGRQTHFSVLFEGHLRAINPVELEAAVVRGIGPSKGYGFGLLSLAPVGNIGQG